MVPVFTKCLILIFAYVVSIACEIFLRFAGNGLTCCFPSGIVEKIVHNLSAALTAPSAVMSSGILAQQRRRYESFQVLPVCVFRDFRSLTSFPMIIHLDITMCLHQDANMRTTLTIDDDVAGELNRLAGAKRGGLRSAVNQLLRRGLSAGARPAAKQKRFVVHSQACGFLPGIDPLKLNALNDEMETEAFVASHRGDRKGK
jgi:hypothetical protein